MFPSDRGVRPMGRAGAFVAGADDLSSIWYNPAGLTEVKRSVGIDFGYLRISSEFQRTMRIVDADGTVRYTRSPNMSGTSPLLPIPNMALAFPLDKEGRLTLALGMTLPYFAMPNYPEMINGQPSPARNPKFWVKMPSLGLFPGAWLGYKLSPAIRIGIGVQVLAVMAKATGRFTAYLDDRLLGPPESVDADTYADLDIHPFIAPTANLGILAIPDPSLRFGFSFQAPTMLRGSATAHIRPPASLGITEPVDADTSFRMTLFPAVARFGIEARPLDVFRFELAYVHEFWSWGDDIAAKPTAIDLGPVFGTSRRASISPIRMQRNYVDSHSLRMGLEYRASLQGTVVDLRAGASYDTSAVPREYVSTLPMSLDANKVIVGGGAGFHVHKQWTINIVYSHLFFEGLSISPKEAKVGPLMNAVVGGDMPVEAINGGKYRTSADLFGAGVDYTF